MEDSAIDVDLDLESEKKRKGRSYKRKLWTDKEDEAITNLVGIIGECNWGTIAERMFKEYGIKGRTGKQCRERWHNHLDPNVRKDPVTEKEEKAIFELHVKFGKKWAEIARELDRRTDNCIKNHFYSTLRRYTRKVNKFMKNEAFKKLTKHQGFKISTEFLYKKLNENKVEYEELKTVDTDQWSTYQKHYAKNLSEKVNINDLDDFIAMLQKLVEKRKENFEKIQEEQYQLEEGANSRRSSRASTKKRKNYSEDAENYNLYLLMELINLDSKFFVQNLSLKTNRQKSKQQKAIYQDFDRLNSNASKLSKVFRNSSFGKEKKKSSTSFKKSNIETHKIETDSEPDDNDSLDMNIGKVVKRNTSINKRTAKAAEKQHSTISFLQNARGISKQSSIGKAFKKDKSVFKNPSNIGTTPRNFAHMQNTSIPNFDRYTDYPLTRNKTKVLNFENMGFMREESDPAYRPSVFNEGNNFNTADHYFDLGINSKISYPIHKNASNVSGFNLFRESSNSVRSPKFPDKKDEQYFAPLKTENLKYESKNLENTLQVQNPNEKKLSETPSFGKNKKQRNNRIVSQPMPIKRKHSTTHNGLANKDRKNSDMLPPQAIMTRGAVSKPLDLINNLRRSSRVKVEGAFSKFRKIA